MGKLRIESSLNINWGATLGSQITKRLEPKTCEVLDVRQSKSTPANAVAFVRHPDWDGKIVVKPSLIPYTESDGFYEFASEVVLGFERGGNIILGTEEPKAEISPKVAAFMAKGLTLEQAKLAAGE